MKTTQYSLAFLVLIFGCFATYTPGNTRTLSNSDQAYSAVMNNANETEEHNDLGTALVVYGLITAVYGAYWLRQKP